MNFAIPHSNAPELIIHIWKIIDLPSISMDDLIYKISFEYFIILPQKAEEFIYRSINDGILKKDKDNYISLSNILTQKLKKWQVDMRNDLINKMESSRKMDLTIKELEGERRSDFSTLLKSFLDKGTINRAAAISDDAFQLSHIDYETGIIKAEVAGSKEEFYNIEINTGLRRIAHNCHDFENNRAHNKKFCKHLAKFFLLLKEKNAKSIGNLLKEITLNINDWEFSS